MTQPTDTLEAEIQAKANKAPRVTPADIEAEIAHTEIVKHVAPSGQVLRWAVLTLRNGYAVAGKPSAAASSANDDAEIGEKVAIANTREEIWPLLGYELRSKLALIEQAPAPTMSDGDVKTYVGTKVVHACPMARGAYNKLRGWEVPTDEDPEDEGYLVEYADGGKPNTATFKGYISWSPRDVFEKAYNVGVVLKETTFVDRMVKELEELTERTNKLAAFLGSEKFKGLPAMDQHDLKEQHTAMENYAWHLTARMKRASGLR